MCGCARAHAPTRAHAHAQARADAHTHARVQAFPTPPPSRTHTCAPTHIQMDCTWSRLCPSPTHIQRDCTDAGLRGAPGAMPRNGELCGNEWCRATGDTCFWKARHSWLRCEDCGIQDSLMGVSVIAGHRCPPCAFAECLRKYHNDEANAYEPCTDSKCLEAHQQLHQKRYGRPWVMPDVRHPRVRQGPPPKVPAPRLPPEEALEDSGWGAPPPAPKPGPPASPPPPPARAVPEAPATSSSTPPPPGSTPPPPPGLAISDDRLKELQKQVNENTVSLNTLRQETTGRLDDLKADLFALRQQMQEIITEVKDFVRETTSTAAAAAPAGAAAAVPSATTGDAWAGTSWAEYTTSGHSNSWS